MTPPGRLAGTLAGRPVEITADRRQVDVRFQSLRDTWRVRGAVGELLGPIRRVASWASVTCWLRLPYVPRLQIRPRPGVCDCAPRDRLTQRR